ncbi:MAG: hypothetical protein UW24_C0012G0025 [Parcubacteria group bacterium GW2011_GWA2_44_12]|nr:MAG: hypothetical protein UW24_C0012G0025 [Parcubacteria group bacterium GW2011_GWA2_44_12]
MAEQLAVNQLVVGSSPTPGASVYEQRRELLFLLYSSAFLSVLTLSISFPTQDSHFVSLQTIHSAQ